MAAKLLHSLTDDNPDLQKQIGCMTGIFQIFDRQHILTGGRGRVVGRGHSPKRLPHGTAHLNGGTFRRESNNAHLSSASTERYSHKNIQEKQRISTESSNPSFSSLSHSSSFSSLECNRATQLEPTSFDRIIFPETPSRDPSMSLQNSAPRLSQQSLDLRDLVKDSMYREIQGLSIKAKTTDDAADKQRMPSDIRESLRALAKLRETPTRYPNEPRELLRSSSYHAKDGSSFSILRDAPRFSCDGREVPKSTPLKLKDLPRLSLDSRTVNIDSRSMQKHVGGEFDGKVDSVQHTPGHQARPPSVVAKLMGLETLPDSVSSSSQVDLLSISNSFMTKDVQIPTSSKNMWKEPVSPRLMKPMSRFPIEPAPWIHQKPASRTARTAGKSSGTFPSVYSEIEKRLKDLEFTQSGKDLRALKQILEAMQSKGFLGNEKESLTSNFNTHKGHEQKYSSSKHEAKKRSSSSPSRHYESPIVIMKPAKLVEKSCLPAAAVTPLDGLSGPPKFHDHHELLDSRKGSSSGGRTAKEQSSQSIQLDSAVNSINMNNERTVKSTHTSARPQQLAKDIGNVGPVKSSGSISPRMQQKKLELEKRSRTPTCPDSSKSRRPPNKQQSESNSPGGRRRLKNLNLQQNESRNLNFLENESSVQSNAIMASPSMKKSSVALSEEESAESGFVPAEYSSPVSVLDNTVHKDDSPSPIKYVGKTLKVDVSLDKERDSNAIQETSVDTSISNSVEPGPRSTINRKKLQNVENLVQKLRSLNSSHDEDRMDYIASLCENADPDHRYISEILLASGFLLRELTNFQFHPSGHPINPELFLVLEQTKAGTTEKTAQLIMKEKLHRKLVFDSVNEILARKLSPGSFSEPMLGKRLARRAVLNAQKLLRELCCEIDVIRAKEHKCSSEEEDKRWKNILRNDVMHQWGSWMNFDDEVSAAVLDIERLIFKDLVGEIVIGDSTSGWKTKPGRRAK